MECILNIHIEKLPEGVYLAASDDIQGLVAQGRTIAETIEIARDIARILLEEQGKGAAPKAIFRQRRILSTTLWCWEPDGPPGRRSALRARPARKRSPMRARRASW